jgi:cold shock CspA family protein
MISTSRILRFINTSPCLRDSGKVSGTVKWFNWRKGYGFIIPTDTSVKRNEVFVHQSSIVSSTGFRMLKDGQQVSFECRPDPTGRLQAYNVTQTDGSPINTETKKVSK